MWKTLYDDNDDDYNKTIHPDNKQRNETEAGDKS